MLKKRSGCHRKPRRSAKPMSNNSLTRSTSKNELAAGIWRTLMGKQFIILAIAGVGTIFGFTKAHAGGLAFDTAGNLFVADFAKRSVFKYTPDGTKSTFVAGLKSPIGLCLDRKSTRLNSSHRTISYAVFCLKKKKLRLQLIILIAHKANKRIDYQVL